MMFNKTGQLGSPSFFLDKKSILPIILLFWLGYPHDKFQNNLVILVYLALKKGQ